MKHLCIVVLLSSFSLFGSQNSNEMYTEPEYENLKGQNKKSGLTYLQKDTEKTLPTWKEKKRKDHPKNNHRQFFPKK